MYLCSHNVWSGLGQLKKPISPDLIQRTNDNFHFTHVEPRLSYISQIAITTTDSSRRIYNTIASAIHCSRTASPTLPSRRSHTSSSSPSSSVFTTSNKTPPAACTPTRGQNTSSSLEVTASALHVLCLSWLELGEWCGQRDHPFGGRIV